jgi:hypothetical protein
MLSHSIANRYTLSACSDRVCCVLDIGACDDSTARQKQSATNAEVGVRAFEMSVSFILIESRTPLFLIESYVEVTSHPSKHKRTVSFCLCLNA